MIEKSIIVKNKLGLHARPAAVLAATVLKFECKVFVSKEDTEVNGRSVMGLMMLAAENGASLKITAQGRDEDAVMQAVERLFEEKFGEE